MRVALFATCLIDALFPDAGRATVQVLERLGQTVEFPLEQTCCGQLHANSGYFEPTLVRRYVDTFNDYDAVVVPSGSCAGDRSCLMHIGGGLARIRAGVKTLHLAEILASADDRTTP